jgi:DNA-binding transcriptional LysR family regulator
MLNEIDLSRTDLNLLVVFETVMRERHVGRAAERLNLTASAVSHGLKRLRSLLDDPLFLRTPRGVVPTQRAEDLAPRIADVLARVRQLVSSIEPFNPAASKRRFVLGAPDGISSVLLPPLLSELDRTAPRVDIGVKQLLPREGATTLTAAWQDALAELEGRRLDVAILPSGEVPVRFMSRMVYEETFVIAARGSHSFLKRPSVASYCSQQHLVVSHSGDPHGIVDTALELEQKARRVALTVPNFMFALAALAGSDLIAALPRQFVETHGRTFGIRWVEPPISLPSYRVSLVATHAALLDAGIAWLVETLDSAATGFRPV